MVFQNNLSGLNLKKGYQCHQNIQFAVCSIRNHIKTRVHTFRELVNGVFIEVILAA